MTVADLVTLFLAGSGGGLTRDHWYCTCLLSLLLADGEQDVSMPAATASNDGYMPKEAFSKLDGIDPGAEVNVDPIQTYTAASDKGTLTLTPGGDTTVVPVATLTEAGLMSAADKTTLNNLTTYSWWCVEPGCWQGYRHQYFLLDLVRLVLLKSMSSLVGLVLIPRLL